MADRSGRFAIVPARALDDTRMTPAMLRTLVALCTYADRDGWCWPRLTMLAKRIGVARPALSRDVAKLVENEYLEVHPQFRADGSQTANKYRVLHDRPLPRRFDRWRPEVVDDDDVVITAEDFEDPAEDGGVSQGATPPVATAREGVSQERAGGRAVVRHQEQDHQNEPQNTPPLHPDDELEALAREVVGEWWEAKSAKPMQGRRTIEKLVKKAIDAGNHPSVVRLALDDCNTFTVAGLQLAISRVQPAQLAAVADLTRPWCETCQNLGLVDDEDDPSLMHPCPSCKPAA